MVTNVGDLVGFFGFWGGEFHFDYKKVKILRGIVFILCFGK
jgi:hypothetical protein